MRSVSSAGVLGLVATSLGLAVVAPVDAGEFPDEWFFSGAQRPAALRALEGQPAPEISIDVWIGDEVSLEDLRGDVVVVDFWATWCGPCMAAIPKNVELVRERGDEGLHIIGVHDSTSGWDSADRVVGDTSINYPVGRDREGESVKAYSLSFWPTYVAVDRKGIVRAAGLTPDRVDDVVAVLLAEERPAGTGPSAGASTSEFPAEWFGEGERPARLLALEGQPAPAIEAAEWAGATDADRRPSGRVMVLHFLAPWSRRSRESLPGLATEAAELRKQGVVVVGIVDHEAALEAVTTILADAEGSPPAFPLARDTPPAEDARLPIGTTATAYGVRRWPMSVVVDRAGRVRAAGVRADRIADVVAALMSERLESTPPAASTSDGEPDARR